MNPKFKYQQTVRVKSGFYEGHKVKIINFREASDWGFFWSKYYFRYLVEIDRYKMEFINEWDLEGLDEKTKP